jgi:hypothetical protein
LASYRTSGAEPVSRWFSAQWRCQALHVPACVAIVTQEHRASAADRSRVLADFTGLVEFHIGQGWILQQVNVGIVARSAILHVLFDGLCVTTFQEQASCPQHLLDPQNDPPTLGVH